jgi:hypothetical protein
MAILKVALEIHPAKTCNRFCGFCGFDSKMGKEMFLSTETAKILSREIRQVPLEFWLNISGGGEPFLHPDLPGIVRSFAECTNIGHIDLVTSGQLPSDNAEIAMRNAILRSSLMKKLSFCLSFNEYNSTGRERVENTLKALLVSRSIGPAIFILLRFSREKAVTTWNIFADILYKIEKKLKEVGEFDSFALDYTNHYLKRSVNTGLFLKVHYDLGYHRFIQRHSLLFGAVLHFSSETRGDKYVVISPQGLVKVGRAKKSRETCMGQLRAPAKNPPDYNWIELLLGYDGYYYPSVRCYYNPVMRLGRIGEDHLSDIIRKKMLLLEAAPDNFLNTTDLREEKCPLCQRKKIELFGL